MGENSCELMKALKNFWFAILGPAGFAGLYTVKDGLGILIGVLTSLILFLKLLIVMKTYTDQKNGTSRKNISNESISPFE
jgi:hypothetical protein